MGSKAQKNFDKLDYAKADDHDNPIIKAAIEELFKQHGEVKQTKAAKQLKLSPYVSYYPTARSVFVDCEDAKRINMGVKEVLALLEERGELCPQNKVDIIQLSDGSHH